MLQLWRCPTCDYQPETMRGWKTHMSKSHGGYSEEQLAEASRLATASEGTSVTEAKSLEEFKLSSPSTDSVAEGKVPRPTKKQLEDQLRHIEAQMSDAERKLLAEDTAYLPYDIGAMLLKDDRFRLTQEEAQPIIDSYLRLMIAYGIQPQGKVWALYFVIMANRKALLRRMPVLADWWKERIGLKTEEQEAAEERVQ